jgi:hypothetical protein
LAVNLPERSNLNAVPSIEPVVDATRLAVPLCLRSIADCTIGSSYLDHRKPVLTRPVFTNRITANSLVKI